MRGLLQSIFSNPIIQNEVEQNAFQKQVACTMKKAIMLKVWYKKHTDSTDVVIQMQKSKEPT